MRRARKIGNAHIFEPTVPRDVARLRFLDEILSFFGGRAAHDGPTRRGRKAHPR